MSSWKLEVDAKEIASTFGALKEQVESTVIKAVGALAASTHAHVLEQATSQLPKSLMPIYKEAMSFEKIGGNIWVVSLDLKRAGFIEDGRKQGFMEELLHGKSSHQGKNGRYAVIPFVKNTKPSEQSPKAQELMSQIKSFLKEKKIPSTKLEFNPDGSPKLGKLYSFNIESSKPSSKAKYPALSGLSIYQRKNEKTGKVKKEILTFRVISESMRDDGRWRHPGGKAYQLIDESFFWAISEWDNNILPEIMNSFK